MVNSSSSQHQQSSAFRQEHEQQQHEQQQPSMGWLLRLPPPLEQQFWQEGSVQGVYTLLDVLATTQALILNWHVLRKFGAFRQEESALLPHEIVAGPLFVVAALLQMASMVVLPEHYRAYRQRIALVNRLLRLLYLLVASLLVTPARAWRQIQVFYTVFGNTPLNSLLPGRSFSGARCATPGWATDAADLGKAQSTSLDIVALWRGLLIAPVAVMMHANWLVPFWVAAALQLATFAVSVHNMLAGCCPLSCLHGPASARIILQACRQTNWLAHAAGQLLDWQVPVDPLALSTASDAVCGEPLAALVLLQVWVRLVCLVLVPCALVYCLERSLKAGFLSTRHARANTAAAHAAGLQTAESPQDRGVYHHPLHDRRHAAPLLGVPEGSGSSSAATNSLAGLERAHAGVAVAPAEQAVRGLRQQQRQRQHEVLGQALLAVQPADVQQLLLPGGGWGGG